MSIKINADWKLENGNYKCPYCSKEYKFNGISTHIWRNHEDGINHKSGKEKGCIPWNKGLSKDTDGRVKKSAETFTKNCKDGNNNVKKGWKHSKETIEHLRKISGGVRKGSGRGKSGYYKGYWCDSRWELAWVIYNLDHDIKFIRNKQGFEYIYNGNTHKYFPDFILEDGTYVEIKGYLDNKNKEKINQFKHSLIVISDISKYFDYVKNKYNVNDELDCLYEGYIKTKNSKKEVNENSKLEKIKPLIEMIINSNIDFSKFGWVSKVSNLINMKTQKVNSWMKKYMTDFYNEKCFKKKSNK